MDYTIAPNVTAIGSGDTAPLTGTKGEFTNGNPSTATPATVLPGYQMNAIVQEIRNAIVASGQTPSSSNNTQLAQALSSQAGLGGIQIFTSSGTFTVPSSVTTVDVELWPGGGAGGAAVGTNNAGSGGGGGTYAHKLITGLTPGAGIAVTIGAGGVANSTGTGAPGGATSFDSYLSATGGTGGAGDQGAPGAGGAATGSDFAIVGGTGLTGFAPVTTFAIGGFGGNAPRGGMGGTQAVNAVGNAGQMPGGGGGGASSTSTTPIAGGNGAPGMLIVRW